MIYLWTGFTSPSQTALTVPINAALQVVSLEFIQQVQWSYCCSKVNCLKIGKRALQFCLDRTKSRTLKWHLDFFTEHRTLPVRRKWNDSHFVFSQKFTQTQKADGTQIWRQSTHSSYILKCYDLTKMKSPTCYQLHKQSFLHFWEWVPLVKLHSHLLWSSMNIPIMWHIRQSHTTSKLRNPFKNLCSSQCLFSKS